MTAIKPRVKHHHHWVLDRRGEGSCRDCGKRYRYVEPSRLYGDSWFKTKGKKRVRVDSRLVTTMMRETNAALNSALGAING